ncbi:MAG: hypothetical protein JO250_10515 [Armatimonadetes bacterium]|nr:hypothetical protein [Armatimonadota bacterium]
MSPQTPDTALLTEVRDLKARLARAERRDRLSGACALCALALTALLNLRPQALAGPGVSLASLLARVTALDAKTASLLARVTALDAKTASITTTGTHGHAGATVTFTGVNVRIVNGLGATNGEPKNPTDHTNPVVNGLGNLILGYNATGNDMGKGDVRTGSHNLILGDLNNYASFGGLVAGKDNAISGPYATVTGGNVNTGSGDLAAVSGGYDNTASGIYASVAGGQANTAGGDFASVSGGAAVTEAAVNGWAGGAYHTP